jgi:hypothetical protein
LAGCGRGGKNPIHQALAERPAEAESPAVAFRLAAGRSGGDTRLYALPRLNEAAWRFRTPTLRTERVVGFSRDQDQVYVLGAEERLYALDLGTGRARAADSLVVAATLGPTGRLHLVHQDGSLGMIEHRSVARWSVSLPAPPTGLWAGGAARLIAVHDGDSGRTLTVLSAGKVLAHRQLPPGPMALSLWGDLGAVGVDSGLITFDPADTTRSNFLRLDRPVRVVAISPAGHRTYAADAEGTLLAIDVVQGAVVREGRVPAPPAALRLDPLGRAALARPPAGDSIWIVDLTSLRVVATTPGEWREDLPAVAPDGSLLVVRGDDVVALAPDSLVVTGRVAGGARDLWLVAAWDPQRPNLQLAADTAPRPADPDELHFVQVSSTANEAWAEDLARNLRAAGMQASVLPPSMEEDRYRVVLGPFPTRDAAEATGRKLGRPYWIFTRTREPAVPS